MKEGTLKITFPNDEDYYRFLDDMGVRMKMRISASHTSVR